MKPLIAVLLLSAPAWTAEPKRDPLHDHAEKVAKTLDAQTRQAIQDYCLVMAGRAFQCVCGPSQPAEVERLEANCYTWSVLMETEGLNTDGLEFYPALIFSMAKGTCEEWGKEFRRIGELWERYNAALIAALFDDK